MNDTYMQMNEGWFKDRPDYLKMCTSPTFDNIQQTEQFMVIIKVVI